MIKREQAAPVSVACSLKEMYRLIKKLRVAAYARVSTDKDDQANSLDNQRNYFTDYITRHEGIL